MMRFRSAYDGLADEVSLETALQFTEPGKTQQQFREECDINNIVHRFGVTGQMPVPVRLPTYDDFSAVTDFHTAMNTVRAAQEAFADLPSEVRNRFSNDPGQLLAFVGDARNRDEAVRLGLIQSPSPNAGVAPAATTPPAS